MTSSSSAQNAAKIGNTVDQTEASHWSERRVREFLATRTPDRWLMGLLALAFSLLLLIRLNPQLLSAMFG